MSNKRHYIPNSHRFSSLSKIPQQNNYFKESIHIHQKRKGIKINSPQLYHKMKKVMKKNINFHQRSQSQSIIVRSEDQKKLMTFLGPNYLPKLNSMQTSKSRVKQSENIFYSQNQQKSVKTKRKQPDFSTLDNILTNQDKFTKTYFKQLKSYKKAFNQQKVDFVFPQIKVNDWKISGYLNGDYLLLKGVNKKGKELLKKYLYQRVYTKVREDYQNWVQQKFSFQI